MVSAETPAARPDRLAVESLEKSLRHRSDALLRRLHELTKRRDSGALSLESSMPLEMSLVTELGHLQERLRLLGCHAYDGCEECRPHPPDSQGKDRK